MTVATYHQKPRKGWPYPDRNYVEFTLEKRGQDTASVINSLAHITHRNPKMFSYYGTKDKRAVTTQRVTAYRINPVAAMVRCEA